MIRKGDGSIRPVGVCRWVCSNVDGPTYGFIADAIRPRGGISGIVALIDETGYRRGLGLGAMGRWWLRIRMYGVYPLLLAMRLLEAPRGSTFVVTTNCFYAPLLASLIGRLRRISVTHLLFDLYPDGLEVGRKIPVNGLAARVLGAIPRWTQRRVAGVVYIGETLRRHVEARWGGNPRSTCIDVGTDETLFPASPPAWTGGELSIRYGGQLGYFHDAELVASCVRAVCGDPRLRAARFIFLASGAGARFLHKALADLPVKIDLPVEEGWREELVRHPVGLVTLSPRGATVCLPSKTYGMLAGSQAVLALCPAWSDLARIVREHDCGWVVENSPYRTFEEMQGPDYLERVGKVRDPASVERDFRDAINHILTHPEEVEVKRRRARRAAEVIYSSRRIGGEWRVFLDQIESELA